MTAHTLLPSLVRAAAAGTAALATLTIAAGAPALAATGADAAPGAPYKLVALTTVAAMPEGDWDQMVADVAHNRLYVAAEDGDAVDVFDLKSGKMLLTRPLSLPHKIALDRKRGHLLVADGKNGTVVVMTTDLKPIKTIPVGPHPDTGVLDAVAGMFYVSSRDGDASQVSAISLDTLDVVRRFPIAATTLKGLAMDKAAGQPATRLFVSMRDKNSIGVIHLADGKVETWATEGLKKSVPLAFDATSQRLFAGGREPGKLIAVDAHDGRPLQTLDATETADSMSYDRVHRILYVSGDTGMSRYRIATDGSAELLGTDPALIGKTSLYVGKLHRLYVMRPKKPNQIAALQVYTVAQ